MRCYDFRCDDCGRVFEELVEGEGDAVSCPACKSSRATKQLSGFAIGRSSSGGAASASGFGGCMGGGCGGGACGLN